MHIMLAWNVTIDDETDRKATNDRMRGALDGYSWVRVMPSVYVVKIDEADERDRLQERLREIAKEEDAVKYIISPLMTGGQYNGWLPKRLWPKINERDDVGEGAGKFFISSILASAVVGFLVAYLLAVDVKLASTTYIGWTLVVFLILFAISFIVAIRKRMSLRGRGKDIKPRKTVISEKTD
jgi:hypothetical protein